MTSVTQTSAAQTPAAQTSAAQSVPYSKRYSHSQIKVWLRGLLTIAWADGQFEASEKQMIHAMVESEFAPNLDFDTLEPIEPQALADELHLDAAAAQNFLRMAVMVALANGMYSEAENTQVMAFAEALCIEPEALASLKDMLQKMRTLDSQKNARSFKAEALPIPTPKRPGIGKALREVEPLKPAREWLDQLSVEDPRFARFICKLVPPQCPFERDVKLFGHKVVHIPPMCKINPLYDQLVGLRFRALSYLADDCAEDISPYI